MFALDLRWRGRATTSICSHYTTKLRFTLTVVDHAEYSFFFLCLFPFAWPSRQGDKLPSWIPSSKDFCKFPTVLHMHSFSGARFGFDVFCTEYSSTVWSLVWHMQIWGCVAFSLCRLVCSLQCPILALKSVVYCILLSFKMRSECVCCLLFVFIYYCICLHEHKTAF